MFMTLAAHCIAPDPPRLGYHDTKKLPKRDQDCYSIMESNLSEMTNYAREFAQCIALFEVCQKETKGADLWRNWMWIAPKAAIISLYNYRKAMDDAMSGRRSCLTIRRVIDNAALEAAQARFREMFPNTRELRQTVMHGSERFSNEGRKGRNQISKGYEGDVLVVDQNSTGVVTGATIEFQKYSALFNGTMYSLDMTTDRVTDLISATMTFFAPFDGLGEKLTRS